MLQRAQKIARQRVYHGNGARATLQRALKTLAIDPVPYPIRQISNDAGVVDVSDGGMIQAAQGFGLTDEPEPGRLVRVEVHAQTYSAPQDQVLSLEKDALERYSYGSLEPVPGAKRCVRALVVPGGLGRAQRSNPRRRSILT